MSIDIEKPRKLGVLAIFCVLVIGIVYRNKPMLVGVPLAAEGGSADETKSQSSQTLQDWSGGFLVGGALALWSGARLRLSHAVDSCAAWSWVSDCLLAVGLACLLIRGGW